MAEKVLITRSPDETAALFGSYDSNIEIVEKEYEVKICNRPSESGVGDTVVVSGEGKRLELAYSVLVYLEKMVRMNTVITDQTVSYVINIVNDGQSETLSMLDDDCVCITMKGKPIKAKTVGQKKYVEAIKKNTIVLGVGPAGTGKTFLAVAMAVKALRNKEVSRIILTRPAVEAGESLGFLPGDLQSKIDPYLRPLYDALYEMLGFENCARYIEKMAIEIAPLAYMRGRTLDDSFIILDEAQNTTPEQMKMFLTRLGFNSKVVVTGDLTQTDLPSGKRSGLAEAVKIVRGIDDIAIHEFSDRDVVRHKLVQKIILAYDRYDREKIIRRADKKDAHKKYKVNK